MEKFISRFLIVLSISNFLAASSANVIPITGNIAMEPNIPAYSIDKLANFSQTIENGEAGQLVGAYVSDKFALKVIQQPSSNPAFVSKETEKVTQFSQATQFGSIGLIAHNNLAGEHFFDLDKGDRITLIYGDGAQKAYVVCDTLQYQALRPNSPYSDYVNLDHPSVTLGVEPVFRAIYAEKSRLVLQTCIARGNVDSWGRLFVIAEPVKVGCSGYNLIN